MKKQKIFALLIFALFTSIAFASQMYVVGEIFTATT